MTVKSAARAALAQDVARPRAPLKRVLSGTSTPPADCSPSAATTHSQQFGAQIATRSPGSMPSGDERAGGLVRLRGELGKVRRDVAVYDRLP